MVIGEKSKLAGFIVLYTFPSLLLTFIPPIMSETVALKRNLKIKSGAVKRSALHYHIYISIPIFSSKLGC